MISIVSQRQKAAGLLCIAVLSQICWGLLPSAIGAAKICSMAAHTCDVNMELGAGCGTYPQV